MPDDKMLLGISLAERERLVHRLGYTNGFGGYIHRDSKGDRLAFPITVDTTLKDSRDRKVVLAVVTAAGVHVRSWRFANERMADDEGMAVWQDPTNYVYHVQGQPLPKGTHVMDMSGQWVLLLAPGRRPWLAKLDTPTVVSAELPEQDTFVHIFARDQAVHVFARQGWRKEEGPLRYFVYDFAKSGSQPLKEATFPWARTALEMDPETGFVVITGNQRSGAPCFLMDLKTGRRERISWPDWHVIVKKGVAQKWIELTKP